GCSRLEQQVLRLQIVGSADRQGVARSYPQLHAKRTGDIGCDVGLDLEHVAGRPVVSFGPTLQTVPAADELGADPHGRWRAADAAGYDTSNVEAPGNSDHIGIAQHLR